MYDDNLALFRLALKTFGRVDHAFSIAGIAEQGRMIEPGMTVESVEKACLCFISQVTSTG